MCALRIRVSVLAQSQFDKLFSRCSSIQTWSFGFDEQFKNSMQLHGHLSCLCRRRFIFFPFSLCLSFLPVFCFHSCFQFFCHVADLVAVVVGCVVHRLDIRGKHILFVDDYIERWWMVGVLMVGIARSSTMPAFFSRASTFCYTPCRTHIHDICAHFVRSTAASQ